MKVAIWSEPDDVEAALACLGLAVAPLVVAVNRGHLAHLIHRTSRPHVCCIYTTNVHAPRRRRA